MVWQKVERMVVDGRKEAYSPELGKDRDKFLSLTSLTWDEFVELYEKIKEHTCRMGYRRYSRSAKKNNYGAGRPHELPLIDRVVVSLIQLRGSSAQMASSVFRVSHDIAKAALDELLSAITACTDTPIKVAARLLHQGANRSLLEFMLDDDAAVDATVINTTRPSKGECASAYYRRKKGVGLNVQTIVDTKGYFVDIAVPMPASIHDIKVFRQNASPALLRQFRTVFGDNGYTSAEKVPHTHIEVASRRPPGGRLTDEAFARNVWIASRRYVVERGNAFIKNYGIVKRMHWYESEKLHRILQAIGGLINFRTARREKRPVNWGNGKRRPRPRKPNPEDLLPDYRTTTSCQTVFDQRAERFELTIPMW